VVVSSGSCPTNLISLCCTLLMRISLTTENLIFCQVLNVFYFRFCFEFGIRFFRVARIFSHKSVGLIFSYRPLLLYHKVVHKTTYNLRFPHMCSMSRTDDHKLSHLHGILSGMSGRISANRSCVSAVRLG
jgi:hypothetical protein